MTDRDDDGNENGARAVYVPDRPRRLAIDLEALKHQRVVVVAGGFAVRGVLVGADESDLYLKGELRWWVFPMDTVAQVTLDDGKEPALGGWRPADDDTAPADRGGAGVFGLDVDDEPAP